MTMKNDLVTAKLTYAPFGFSHAPIDISGALQFSGSRNGLCELDSDYFYSYEYSQKAQFKLDCANTNANFKLP